MEPKTGSEIIPRLKGRVALVTGAARGIGKAAAAKMTREGAFVVLLDTNMEELTAAAQELGRLGGNALPLRADIAERRQVDGAVEKALREFGRIDILVNNAGQGQVTPLEKVRDEDWDRVVQVNLKGTFHCTQAVLPGMKENRCGKIVNISSRSSLGILDRTVYGATKAGIIGMTRVWALELAPFQINVNCVAPGPVATEHFKRFNPEESQRTKQLIQSIPLGRMGTPEDVANLISFLASEEASWITGQTIFICGGLTVGMAHF